MTIDVAEDPPPNDALGPESSVSDPAEFDPGDVDEFETGPEAFEELLAIEEAEAGLESRALPPVKWASDADHPDFAHSLDADSLNLPITEEFTFDAAVFELLARANHFKPRGTNNLVAFGLRGGSLVGADSQRGKNKVTIRDTRPDHTNFRCTLGVIDTDTGKISAFVGSTVPNQSWMRNYYKIKHNIRPRKSTRCNMLPTGCYIYRVNAHGGGRIKPALRMTDPDNLTADAACTVLRTFDDLKFAHDDLWDRCVPYDNIHCAYSNSSFSSAGCQTIKGPNGRGPWGHFQSIIGALGWNARIDYMLLSAREAAIAAAILKAGKQDDVQVVRTCLERLRVGSEGEMVAALQRQLGFSGSGYFGPSTKKRLTEHEAAHGLATDGIYAPADDAKSNWTIFGSASTVSGQVSSDQDRDQSDPTSQTVKPPPEPDGRGDVQDTSSHGTSSGWRAASDLGGVRYVAPPGVKETKTEVEVVLQTPSGSIAARVSAQINGLDPDAENIGIDLLLVPSITHSSVMLSERSVSTGTNGAQPEPEPIDDGQFDPGVSPQTDPVAEQSVDGQVVITEADIDSFAPRAKRSVRKALIEDAAEILGSRGILANGRRLAHFLAQLAHESGGLRLLVESLNYTSARRIRQVWPRRFRTLASAQRFVRNEEALANRVYGDRLGNARSGDGFRYRGRGLIQLTGRELYQDYSNRLGIDLVGNPDLASEPRTALLIAAEYWAARKLKGERDMNALADDDKLRAVTYRINGGTTNLGDRESKLNKAKSIWGEPESLAHSGCVDRGDRSDTVREIQSLLIGQRFLTGSPDGKFGYNTYRGLRRFKEAAALDGVGFADPATLQRLRAGAGRESLIGGEVDEPLPVIGDDPEPIREGSNFDEDEDALV